MKTSRKITLFDVKGGNVYKIGFGQFGKVARLLGVYIKKTKRNKWELLIEYED